jgi:hypothetical protein
MEDHWQIVSAHSFNSDLIIIPSGQVHVPVIGLYFISPFYERDAFFESRLWS